VVIIGLGVKRMKIDSVDNLFNSKEYRAGFRAGTDGLSREDNPFDTDTEYKKWNFWDVGWHDGIMDKKE